MLLVSLLVSLTSVCLSLSVCLILVTSICLLSAFEPYLFRTQYDRAVSRIPEMNTKFVDIRAGNGFLSTDPLPQKTFTFISNFEGLNDDQWKWVLSSI